MKHDIDFGDMDREIQLQTRTETQSVTIGEVTDSYSTLATVWAAVRTVSSKEVHEAGQVLGVEDKAFIIHYRDDVVKKMRIVYEGKNYDVQSVVELGVKEFLRVVGKAVN